MGNVSGEVWRFTMRGSYAAPAELCAAVGPSTSATAVSALMVASPPPTLKLPRQLLPSKKHSSTFHTPMCPCAKNRAATE